jgi:hypothetical protein
MADGSTRDDLAALADLRPGWDGYGAVPVDPRNIEAAAGLLADLAGRMPAPPAVVPMTRGRLQLEWHRGRRSLELEFADPDHVHYLMWPGGPGAAGEDIIPVADRDAVARLLGWLAAGDGDRHAR